MSGQTIPVGHVLVRSTPQFDEHTVPAGLLASHRIAPGVWGRLVVLGGGATFAFDDEADAPRILVAGHSIVIPPERAHRVVITGPVRFVVEFYSLPRSPSPITAHADPTIACIAVPKG